MGSFCSSASSSSSISDAESRGLSSAISCFRSSFARGHARFFLGVAGLAAAFFALRGFFGRGLFGGCREGLRLGVVPGAQDLVDEGLIAFALGAELLEEVAVEPQRDDVLAGGNDDAGFVPVDVERRGVWIVCDGAAISSSVMASRRA